MTPKADGPHIPLLGDGHSVAKFAKEAGLGTPASADRRA